MRVARKKFNTRPIKNSGNWLLETSPTCDSGLRSNHCLAKGIGATRAGVFESSFREEAELDLFAEQVVWAGLVAWFEECFKLGVENGFSPELMALELYASGEASEILGLMARPGFYRQMSNHSTTSQYGTLSRAIHAQ